MSLKPQGISPVPEETARIARAAYPKGNVYMHMRDELGTVYEDESFAHLFPNNGQPAEAPWRLALVTIMQFAEGLSDRQAADAVRGRIDWKYALSLDLTDSGFDASVLTEFRMGVAWKTHACLREKKTVRPGPNRLGKMEARCSALCLPQAPPPGYGKCQLWSSYAASGCKIISGPRESLAGAPLTTSRLRGCILAHRMIWMRTRASKRSTSWVGDIRPLDGNEAQQDSPHLITHVETTTAPVSDDARTASIHAGLKHKDLLPGQHLVDTGYVDAELLHRRKPGVWD